MSAFKAKPAVSFFSSSQESRRLLILLFGSLLIFSAGIGMRALWNPNESVYGEGVREMIVRGDYYLPYVNGRIYSDKPIFYFWTLLASSWMMGGLSEVALRIPSVASGVLTVLLVYLLGRLLFGIRAGFLAAACLSTSMMFWWHSQYVQMDQLLSFLIMGALVLLFLAKEIPGRWPGLYLAGSGALMGLGFLTKGPVALVLPVGIFGCYLLFTGQVPWVFRREILWAAAVFILVAAPWYLSLASTGHTSVLEDFFIKHNLQRATDPFNHDRPFWYYIPRFFSDLFPWSLLIPAAFFVPVRNPLERRGRLLAWTWLGFIFLLFSAAGAKRGVYLLPLYPAAALLVGKYWDEFLSGGLTRQARGWGWGFLLAVACLFLVMGVASPLLVMRSEEYRVETLIVLPLGLITVIGGGLLLLSLWKRRMMRSVALVGLTMASIFLYTDLFLLKAADRYKSPVDFTRTLQRYVAEDDEIRSLGLWRWDSAYIFYMKRLIPDIQTSEELLAYLGQEKEVFLLVESTEMDRTLAQLGFPVRVLAREKIGHKDAALVTNRPEGF